LLTHGSAPTLYDCLDSFAKQVTPAPAELLCVVDGAGRLPPVDSLGVWRIVQNTRQQGFCKATRMLWRLAASSEHPYVLYLENDFLFTRELDLRPLAKVLDHEPTLAQMQLMRDAVNREEKAAGGLFESRPGEYYERYYAESSDAMRAGQVRCWQEHHSYLTTNPSLMRREFMAENSWPDDGLPECEGRFGVDLVAKGYSFGVWGNGQPWTRHVGKRLGFGY